MFAEQPRRRFTAAEVARMVEVGILAEDEPLELIDGELIAMSPQGPVHSGLTAIIRDQLTGAFGAGFHVQDHSPVDAGIDSLPEPDVAVVRGDRRRLLGSHPTAADLELVVEVSVTSHRLDRAKAAIYARAGIPVFWHVEVPERRVTVFTEPVGGEYRTLRIFTDDEHVPVAGGRLAVADLLP